MRSSSNAPSRYKSSRPRQSYLLLRTKGNWTKFAREYQEQTGRHVVFPGHSRLPMPYMTFDDKSELSCLDAFLFSHVPGT